MMSIFNDKYSIEQLRKNWEYYEPRAEPGTSLSACMYSLVSCQIGNSEAAYPFFMNSAGVDLRLGGKEWAAGIYRRYASCIRGRSVDCCGKRLCRNKHKRRKTCM